MTCYIIGSHDTAFTVGIADCEERGEVLPFFAFAPTNKIVHELNLSHHTVRSEDTERVKQVADAFRAHGTLVFLDNLQAADSMLEMVLTLLDRISETSWVKRQPKQETLQ
jgi:hypothetical protein